MPKGLFKDLSIFLQHRAKHSTRARSPVGTDEHVVSGDSQISSVGSALRQQASAHPSILPEPTTLRGGEFVRLDQESSPAGPQPAVLPSPQVTSGTRDVALLGPHTASGILPNLNSRSSLSQKVSGLSAIVPTAITQSSGKPGLKVAVETGWKGFKSAMEILKEASVVFPPLQAAIGVLAKILEIIDQASDNREQFTTMAKQLRILSDVVKKYSESGSPPDVRDRIEGMTEAINRETKFIEERVQTGITGRILNGTRDAQEIVNSLRAISLLTDRFQVDTLLNTERQVHQINKRLSYMQFRPLPETGACFGRPMILEDVLHKCDKYWLYTANDEGKVAIVKKYRKVQEEEFLQFVQGHHALWHPQVAQVVRMQKSDKSLIFHPYQDFQPSTSVADAVISQDMKAFFYEWRDTIQEIEELARETNMVIAWEACQPGWFWHNGKNWVLFHWEERNSPFTDLFEQQRFDLDDFRRLLFLLFDRDDDFNDNAYYNLLALSSGRILLMQLLTKFSSNSDGENAAHIEEVDEDTAVM